MSEQDLRIVETRHCLVSTIFLLFLHLYRRCTATSQPLYFQHNTRDVAVQGLYSQKILCRQMGASAALNDHNPERIRTDAINRVCTQQNAQQKMSEQDYGICMIMVNNPVHLLILKILCRQKAFRLRSTTNAPDP